MKKNKKAITIIVIAAFTVLFIGLSFLIDTSGSKPSKNTSDVPSAYDWLAETQKKDESVITVLALTTCQYCQAYKPIITKIANDYNLKLFFYEVDSLSSTESEILTSSYELKNYEGYVPFTFVLQNGEVVSDNTGYMDEESTIQFLREAGVIKD